MADKKDDKIISDWSVNPGKQDIYGILFSSVILILLVSPFIGRSLWTDEIFSVISSRDLAEMLGMIRDDENNMALYYFLLHGWTNIFGESEISVRSLSLLFAVLTIPLVHILVFRFYGRKTAFVADLLLVSNPIFLYYAIETRSYSFLMFLSCLSTLVLFHFFYKPRPLTVVIYSFIIAASVYVHYFGIFIPFCHVVYLTFKGWIPRNFKLFLLAAVIVIILVSPLFIFHPGSAEQISWIPEPQVKYIVTVVSRLFGHKLIFIFVVVTGFYMLWKDYRDKVNSLRNEHSLLSLSGIMILFPVFVVYLVSVFYMPVMLLRYFSWIVPFSVIIIAITIGFFNSYKWIYVIFGLCLLLELSNSYNDLDKKGSGYKQTASFIQQSSKEGDALLCYPFTKTSHVEFYSSRVAKDKKALMPASFSKGHIYPGGGRRDPDVDMDVVQTIAMNSKRVFVVCSNNSHDADIRQNRHWLPRIIESIRRHHPTMKEKIFQPNTDEPIMLLIFE